LRSTKGAWVFTTQPLDVTRRVIGQTNKLKCS